MKKLQQIFLHLMFIFSLSISTIAFSATEVNTDTLMTSATSTTAEMSGINVLRQIFGDIVLAPMNAIKSDGHATIFAELFFNLNMILMAISVIFVSYNLASSVAKTAEAGKFLGDKDSSVWVPIRLITGVSSLAPLFGGWSFAQLIALWCAVLGVGAGNLAYVSSVKYLVAGGALVSQPFATDSQNHKLVNDLFLSSVCLESDIRDKQLHNQILQTAFSPMAIVKTGNSVFFGDTGICGSFKMPTVSTASSLPSNDIYFSNAKALADAHTLQTAAISSYSQAFDILLSKVQSEAVVLVSSVDISNPVNTAFNDANLLLAEKEFSKSIYDSNANLTNASSEILTAETERAKSQGFLTAGAYFMSIARTGQATSNAIKVSAGVMQNAPDDKSNFYSSSEYYKNALNNLAFTKSAKEALITLTTQNPDNSVKGQIIFKTLHESFGEKSLGQWFVKALTPSPSDKNFILVIKDLGDTVAVSGETLYAVALSLDFASGNMLAQAVGVATGANRLIDSVLNLLKDFAWALIIVGIILSTYIPFIPVIYWVGGLVSWIGKVIEGVANASFWAFAHLDTSGEGMGQRTSHGYQFLLTLLLYPVLMIIGLFTALIMMQTVGNVLLFIFPLAIEQIQENTFTGLFSIIAFLCIFGIVSISLISSSCEFIHIFPDTALNWIGGQSSQGAGKSTSSNFAGMANVNKSSGGMGDVAIKDGRGQGGGGDTGTIAKPKFANGNELY